ncbi:3-deoxy-8-phosphooctulonate synthase [Engelhardtia mirabilis]|uniref:2-dehydro-3-deoxyphosphooctonate aldolase n=1 Tax=Engelhardtia mirabilis TaxID=2528011 RepID=A0A518BPT3_9BACT|nr:2-dehydro-3-deoxyphosphooctonate aldolase [Planctomycetes bacterium Pla133]QDV03318.1 2-dehydro-3-deoxyphosphooctonate aldolase [Planctomycetes bacterium Pla86]
MADSPAHARPAVQIGNHRLGGGELFLISGPCVLERRDLTLQIAERLRDIAGERGVTAVFKASFDKANRTSIGSGRGPGPETGLEWLAEVRETLQMPVLTDVHLPDQCAVAAASVDVLQIPAFLCRQTDLLVAAAESGAVVNVKKGQFLAPWDMRHVAAKVRDSGNDRVIVTERGSSFGYGRLVVDMAGFADLDAIGVPVVFDATHSVQRPGGSDGRTGGDRSLVPALARAAVATGQVDGLFFEVHPDPDSSPSDGPNMVRLDDFPAVLDGCLAVFRAARGLS